MTILEHSAPPAGTSTAPAGAPSSGTVTRSRLAHIDAMRPVKQLAVVSTHSFLALAPATLFVGAGIILLHVAREAFLFVSACMLTYGYKDLRARDLTRFWRRRLVAVGAPYLVWTLIYFFVGLPNARGGAAHAALRLGYLSATGYSQLYFLVVLLEFYVLFPFVAWLLRRTTGHHRALVIASAIFQLLYVSAMHWGWLPGELRGTHGTRFVLSYQFYLLAGSVAAVHYEAFHRWILRHARLIVIGTLLSGALVEAWYWLEVKQVIPSDGAAAGAFQPIVVPFNVAAILLIYLIGVWLVQPRRPEMLRTLTHLGVEDSYAIYLSQVLFIDGFVALGWKNLDHVMPWPLALVLGIVTVFVCGGLTGEILARTPLARIAAGRSRASRRRGPRVAAPGSAAEATLR
jgi:peptidoglycan/LPS O-acetylase OafA/YrhL